jgi:uncharacterized membrane protein (UPF0127 family)
MTKQVAVVNRTREDLHVAQARWCGSWFCRLRGLTFRRGLPGGSALLLDEGAQSRSGTSIHMFFVFMDLGVVWIDREGRVVDRRIARPWRVYFPAAAARYVLEGEPAMIDRVQIGDQVEFRDLPPS